MDFRVNANNGKTFLFRQLTCAQRIKWNCVSFKMALKCCIKPTKVDFLAPFPVCTFFVAEIICHLPLSSTFINRKKTRIFVATEIKTRIKKEAYKKLSKHISSYFLWTTAINVHFVIGNIFNRYLLLIVFLYTEMARQMYLLMVKKIW